MIDFAQVRAVVRAQWRSIRNYSPRASRVGIAFSAIGAFLWYGACAAGAVAAAVLFANPQNEILYAPILNGGLLLAFLYFQVVPILLASTGFSLNLKRLLVYPIPREHLFALEVLLRASVAGEVLLLLAGVSAGILLNPALPLRGMAGMALFVALNLFLSTGLRDLIRRLLARRRVREVVVFLLVLMAALPQLLLLRDVSESVTHTVHSAWFGLAPWTAAADVVLGGTRLLSWASLVLWTLAAWGFGRWQFSLSLRFDEREAAAASPRPIRSRWSVQWIFGWPSALFRDPLGGLVEKELRFLARSPRFRLVFLMGFSFGLLVWLPLAFGSNRGSAATIAANYLTFVSSYALLLLAEVSFYNVFGFDRGAAQAYYILPVPFRTVLLAKNLAAIFFVIAEVTAVAAVCALLGMPISVARVAEAYSVAAVLSVDMLAVGNLSSTYFPRAVDPAQSWQSGSVGRFHGMLLLIYPVLSIPILLAYLARYAFQSALAFSAVLAVAAVIAAVFYGVAMDSAVSAAERRKELILTALGHSSGPVSA